MINQKVWYSVSQDDENELTNDVWLCGVIVKSGYIIEETEDFIRINNFSNNIRKKAIIYDAEFDCGCVAFTKHDLLMDLHYDGCDIYNEDETLKEGYTHDEFVIFKDND